MSEKPISARHRQRAAHRRLAEEPDMVGTYCLRCRMMTGLLGHAPDCPVGRTEGDDV